MTKTIQAYDQCAHGYADIWFDDPVMEQTIREFAKALGPGARVLDAGCGPGRDVKFMSHLGLEVVGADLSEGMIQEARHRFPSGTFRWMDMRNLRFPRQTFSGIWCCAAIHHLKRYQAPATLAEFSRVLAENGVLAVSIEVSDKEGERYDNIGRFAQLYTAANFRTLLMQAGFDIVWEQQFTNKKTTVQGSAPKQWLRFLARKAAVSAPRVPSENYRCHLCLEHRFESASKAGLPGPGSIITGDDSFYLAPDVAPMVDGHLLLVSCDHIVSFGGLPASLDEAVARYVMIISQLFESTYHAVPLFFEHGGRSEGEDEVCTDHAHWHCIPASEDRITALVESQFGKGSPADLSTLRSFYSSNRSYLFIKYAFGEGRVFPVQFASPQFFRQLLARTAREDISESKLAVATAASAARHRLMCDRLIPTADALLMPLKGGPSSSHT